MIARAHGSWRRTGAAALGLVLGAGLISRPSPAAAQTSLQVPLQFDFINPGAKSLAMGGAFSGLADDATATFANPAGLTQLGASEASFELRRTRVSTPFLASGRLSGTISNQGIDTIQGPEFGTSVGQHSGVGFAAGVYVHPSRKWVIAAYRHELVRFDQAFLSTGVFQKAPEELTSRRDTAQALERSMSVTGYGAAGSYKVRPNISIGASLASYSLDFESVVRRFDTAGFLGAPLTDVVFGRTTQIGDEVSLAPTIGVVVEESADAGAPLIQRTRIGIVYRFGPSFGYTTATDNGPSRVQRFRIPDTFAIGASLRVRPQLVLAVEATHISHSMIERDFVVDQALDAGRVGDFRVDDGTEIHVGAQYTWTRFRALPRLRLGSWFDPNHSVGFRPSEPAATVPDRIFDERLATALSRGTNQVHITGGLGVTIHRRVELNVGADLAKHQTRVSTSLIVR